MFKARVREGLPYPLGATWDGKGVNFALFSANATKVEVCLFDPKARPRLDRIELPEYTDQIWHGYLPDVGPGQRLRLSRPRSLRAGRRAIASTRTSCCSIPMRRAHIGDLEMGPGGVRLHDGHRTTT